MAQIENMGQHEEGKSITKGVSEGRQLRGDQSFKCKHKDAEGLLALTRGKKDSSKINVKIHICYFALI